MKCTITAAQLNKLLKSVTSIYDFARENPESKSIGLLTVDKKGLWIEYGSAGAYLRKRAEAKVLREGMVGIDLKALQKLRLVGDVTLDAKKSGIFVTVGKKNKYTIPTDQEADEYIEAFRPEPIRKKQKPHVTLPAHVLKLASSCVAYKPGEADKKIRLQAGFKRMKKGGHLFSLSGNDNYSFARYAIRTDDVVVVKNTRFILSSNLLQEIMREVGGDQTIKIWTLDGSDEATSLVRFVAKGFDFCHPVMSGEEFEDPAEHSEEITSGKRLGSFVTTQKALKTAFDAVNVFGTSSDPTMVNFGGSKKEGIRLVVKAHNHKATAELDTEKISVRKRLALPVHSNYLGEFIKVLPKALPVRVEKWEDMLRIEAENLEDGLIEYVVAQGDSDG